VPTAGSTSAWLTDLPFVEKSGEWTGPATSPQIGSRSYDHSLVVTTGDGAYPFIGFNLDHKYKEFTAIVAAPDDEPSDVDLTFKVILDGQGGDTESPNVGKPATIDVRVAGVERLQLQANCYYDCTGARAVWAHLELVPS